VTDLDFEQRLRAGFRGAVDAVAPPALRATVNAIPETVGTVERRGWTAGWGFPRMNRFALALAATAAVVTLAIGIGLLLRPPSVGPSPGPVVPTATPVSPSSSAPVASPQFAYIVGDWRTGQQLWMANMDGTGAHELIPGLAQELNPGLGGNPQATAWSPDGTRLLFTWAPVVGDSPGWGPSFGTNRFYLTDASGSTPQLVDTGCVAPCVGDSDPAFSRDGRHLVFVRSFEIPPASSGINPATGKLWNPTPASVVATIDLSTGLVIELASTTIADCPLLPGQAAPGIGNCSGFADHAPGWSPDGTQIVFTQDVPYDINGPASRDINGMPPPSNWPSSSIFVVDANGQNLHQISTCCRSADWSPDGALIVFESGPRPVITVNPGQGTGYTADDNYGIYTVRPDGSDLRQLTSGGDPSAPAWTTDGRIWFARNGQLWLMDADGSNATQLNVDPQLMASWPVGRPPQP
jgi:Tol biopolymer transport system component